MSRAHNRSDHGVGEGKQSIRRKAVRGPESADAPSLRKGPNVRGIEIGGENGDVDQVEQTGAGRSSPRMSGNEQRMCGWCWSEQSVDRDA